MSDEHPHLATGAYALDALPDDERAAFARHLEGCPACAREVRELTATAALLGSAVASAPPAGMKEAVLAGIEGVRQSPSPGGPPPGAAARLVSGSRRAVGGLVLAACLVVLAGFGGVAAWQWQEARNAQEQARQARAETDRLVAVLAAPDARTVTGTVEGGTRATVVVARSENSAVFVASGLPELPGDRTYQLWFDEDGAMRPAGLVGRDGASLMEGDVDGATGVGVTVEPSGGSPRPTTAPLMEMTLPA
ncbi:anti-sigma factor [Streptomyces ficellus]|uniref:Regulator of SigK n=1 Tax=Streptomyces ficellus TaxID=1977088 RepID=A0A6I6F0K9_9ACTN|nr:anti-sigma factor [Streptomyces ficellus]QGV77240.1 anti-sigma factor [Streptomyces ficellus]